MSDWFHTGLCLACGDASFYLRPRITLLYGHFGDQRHVCCARFARGWLRSATVATTWVTQRTLGKRELIRAEIKRREALYGEFITECSTRVVDSFEHHLEKPETLLAAYALLNRIRLCASNAVLAEAERILHFIAEQYFSPNLSVEELRTLVRSKDQDPLKPFGEACRRIKNDADGRLSRAVIQGNRRHASQICSDKQQSLSQPTACGGWYRHRSFI